MAIIGIEATCYIELENRMVIQCDVTTDAAGQRGAISRVCTFKGAFYNVLNGVAQVSDGSRDMKTQVIAFWIAAVSLAIFGGIAAGDTIELRDGRKISGSMVRQGSVGVSKGDDGSSVTVALTDVVRVTLSDSASPGDAAKSEWLRVGSQIKGAGDLAAINELNKKFLEKYPEAANAGEVRESLGVYQQLADAGGVKFHGKWMAADQVEVTQRQWAEAAAPALLAYKAGKFKEAQDAATTVLVKDQQNTDALTVAGLAAYGSKSYGVARKYFTLLADADPSSGLAQYNLAVVSFQQKQSSEGLMHLAKAVKDMPDNPVLLDGIIEAVNAYKKSGGDVKAANFRDSLAMRSLLRRRRSRPRWANAGFIDLVQPGRRKKNWRRPRGLQSPFIASWSNWKPNTSRTTTRLPRLKAISSRPISIGTRLRMG